MNEKTRNAEIRRLKTILAYELSGNRSFESCDIPTRQRIERLITKVLRLEKFPNSCFE